MYEKKFTLRHTFKNFSELDTVESPVKEHFGVPWMIRAQHVNDNFGLFLCCELKESVKKPWSVEVTLDFRIVNGQAMPPPVLGSYKYKKRIGFGWRDFRNWDNMLKYHVVDNEVTIECDVTIKSMTGIVREIMMNFEDSKENLTDGILKVGDKQFHVAKMLLATFSPYFNALFFANFSESKKSKIELKDVDPEDFQQLLEVVHGALPVNSDNVEALLYLADRFDMPMIRIRCEEFLSNSSEMTNKNRIRIADAHNLEGVKSSCLKNVGTMDGVRAILPANVNDFQKSTLARLLEKAVSL